MVGRIIRTLTNPVRGLHEAAYVLAAFAFLSQLLALVRDRLLAGTFGAHTTLDLYYAAFRVPDFLFATVASLLSLYALMPVLSRLEAEHPGRMMSFLRQSLLWFFVGMGVVAGACFVFAPLLVHLTAPGFVTNPTENANLILLTRILLLQPIFLGASNILANLTQMRHRFVLYSISPLLYNIGIIAGVVFFYPVLGIAGLGWGVVLGAVLHFLIQVPYFAAERVEEQVSHKEALAYLREVLVLSVPRTFALASTQVSLVVLTAIASLLAAGSIAVFTFAYNLQGVPIAIIGVSYSVAAFPTLARLFASGEREKLTEHVENALRHLLFWSIPLTVFVVVLRAQLVRVILGTGAFDWSATRLTAAALALFIISLAAQNLTLLIARTYYAAGNSRKPLYFGLIDIVLSIASAIAFVFIFHSSPELRLFIESLMRVDNVAGSTVLMLALGYAVGSIGEAAVGYWYFARDFRIPQARVGKLIWQSFGASVIGGTAAYGVLSVIGATGPATVLSVFITGFFAGVIGLCVTAAFLYLMGNREIVEVASAFGRRALPGTPLVLEPTDIES